MARQRKKKALKEQLTDEQIVATFVKACGLRKAELERLRVRDFYEGHRDGSYEEQWIHVDGFEDIPAHEVPFLSNDEGIIAAVWGLRLVGTETRNRNVAILGYRREKSSFFIRKTSSETGKAEQ
jgi:hypothetical protein